LNPALDGQTRVVKLSSQLVNLPGCPNRYETPEFRIFKGKLYLQLVKTFLAEIAAQDSDAPISVPVFPMTSFCFFFPCFQAAKEYAFLHKALGLPLE